MQRRKRLRLSRGRQCGLDGSNGARRMPAVARDFRGVRCIVAIRAAIGLIFRDVTIATRMLAFIGCFRHVDGPPDAVFGA